MSKKTLAVVDSDLAYVDRFLKYLKKKRNLPFSPVGFSSVQSLEVYLERNCTDLLLISEDLLDEEGIRKLHENAAVGELVLSGEQHLPDAKQKYINKYRAADHIIRDLVNICSPDGPAAQAGQVLSSDLSVTGIFSPVCKQERQQFALAMANQLSNYRSVLFMSLEPFSGLKDLFKIRTEFTVSDLIYFFSTNRKKIREALPKTVTQINRFDLMLPPRDLEDLDLIEENRWSEFLSVIMEYGSYDEIVLDIGDAFHRPEEIFLLCSGIYIPVTPCVILSHCMEELKDYLAVKEGEHLTDKLFEVPVIKQGDAQEKRWTRQDYLDSCFSGSMMETAETAYYKRDERYDAYQRKTENQAGE